ncbi:LANO_0A07492g1_1 [Lachancea nothofagi CBS 11611]|uniref:LANO_0A07492g1_1 n=1 Tax=Lachancea nothofagi CBS 11611 TaxID=1266666 RepID=A0A1G4ISC0_9SACH|nr:LANO_0A07492g1_1 [Lachancea nothofagi CBS 11611]
MLRTKLLGSLIAAGGLLILLFYSSTHLKTDKGLSIVDSFKNHNEKSGPEVVPIRWDNYLQFTRELDYANSTALFNSVRAALRQSASDIHPVGVSYFPAIIPKGTLMYHAGTEVPKSFEWLAMDHEFSYSFGLRPPSYGRSSLRKPGGRPHDRFKSGENDNSSASIESQPGRPDRDTGKLMLTYRATKDLNKLLYVDGASAAKTDGTGEMDTQEMLSNVIKDKLNLTDDGEDRGMKERLFASRICKWGKPFGLNGIVRVEVGFEVILCDFSSNDVELVSSLEMAYPSDHLGLPPPTVLSKENGWPIDDNYNLVELNLTKEQRTILSKEDSWEKKLSNFNAIKSFNWLLAGAVHDKGDKRIQLDYRYLVTGINRTSINPDPNNRRLLNNGLSWDKQLQMVEDLEQALSVGFNAYESNDWQQVFDEIVDKFAPMLKVISGILSRNESTHEAVAINATAVTLNFSLRFMTQEDTNGLFSKDKEFAVYQYVRPLKNLRTNSDFLIWSAAVKVVGQIVDVIYDVNNLLIPIVRSSMHDEIDFLQASKNIKAARQEVEGLIGSLRWIELDYRCKRVCEWDEVCYTPSWGPSPMGMGVPGSSRAKEGTHYDEDRKRLVIDNELQCISVNELLNKMP